jgi:allantoinase
MHHLDDQRRAIADTISTIERFCGKPPRGWESPGLAETEETLDLLAEAGIEYVADWVVDDLPAELHTAHGPVLSIPYTVETNDIVVHAIQHLPSDAFKKRATDHFDRLYQEGAENARVMAISVHPYLSGVPHRIRFFEELLDYLRQHREAAILSGAEIAEWYRGAAARA